MAAYCRVSTEKEEQLESLANQKAFFEEFAQKSHYELIRIYADEGISGKQMKNRPEFLQLLEDSREHSFDLVVVKDISRFARNTVDFLNAVRLLKSRGIEVLFLTNNQTVLGNSEFVLTIFSALAQEESASLSKRVKFGKKVNAKKGRVPNLIFGYDKVDTFKLKPNPFEANVVRMIFTLYTEAGAGTRSIAAQLSGMQVPTKKGCGNWDPKTVRRILQNPIYKGTLITNKYETTDFLSGAQRTTGPEERFVLERPEYRIVSDEVFEKAQKLLSERGKQTSGATRPSSTYPLSTLIRCTECGRSFIRKQTRDSAPRWRCSGHDHYGSSFCSNAVSLSEADLYGWLEAYLLSKLSEPARLWERIRQKRTAPSAQWLAQQEQYQNSLAKIQREIGKWLTLYQNDVISIEECKQNVSECRRREARLSQAMEQKKAAPPLPDPRFSPERGLGLENWSHRQMKQLLCEIRVSPDGKTEIQFQSANPSSHTK